MWRYTALIFPEEELTASLPDDSQMEDIPGSQSDKKTNSIAESSVRTFTGIFWRKVYVGFDLHLSLLKSQGHHLLQQKLKKKWITHQYGTFGAFWM